MVNKYHVSGQSLFCNKQFLRKFDTTAEAVEAMKALKLQKPEDQVRVMRIKNLIVASDALRLSMEDRLSKHFLMTLSEFLQGELECTQRTSN